MFPVTTETRAVTDADIQRHYDLSNDFFRLWLDPSMTYTCALYEPGDSLEMAQVRKIDHLVDLAKARGVATVADLGCGWGAIARRLVDVHGVGRVVAINISENQIDHIRAWNDPRIEARLESWADHVPAEPYDAVITAGMMEHVVDVGTPAEDRAGAYRAFFRRCEKMLKPGGHLAVQTIALGDAPITRQAAMDVKACAEIFPDSALPRLAELIEAAEGIFEITRLRNDRLMYARTCFEWLERLHARRAAAVAVVGEEDVARYERYLEACVRQFEGGFATLLRFGLRRVERAPRRAWY